MEEARSTQTQTQTHSTTNKGMLRTRPSNENRVIVDSAMQELSNMVDSALQELSTMSASTAGSNEPSSLTSNDSAGGADMGNTTSSNDVLNANGVLDMTHVSLPSSSSRRSNDDLDLLRLPPSIDATRTLTAAINAAPTLPNTMKPPNALITNHTLARMTAHERLEQLHEQIQSMRHIRPTHPVSDAIAATHTHTVPSSSSTLEPLSSPPSPAQLSHPLNRSSLVAPVSSHPPHPHHRRSHHRSRSRAVRFSAFQRNEVLEFDSAAERERALEMEQAEKEKEKEKKRDKDKGKSKSQQQENEPPSTSSVVTPIVRRRSILKHRSSGSLSGLACSDTLDVPRRSLNIGSIRADSLSPRPHVQSNPLIQTSDEDEGKKGELGALPESSPSQTTEATQSAAMSAAAPATISPRVATHTVGASLSLARAPAPSYSDLMRRIYESRQAETARLLDVLRRGAVFLKFHASSSPTLPPGSTSASLQLLQSVPKSSYRFFYISDDASELRWCKLVNTRKDRPPTFYIDGQRKKPQRESVLVKHRSRLLADGLRLFPDSFHSTNFILYNASASPPWLGLTLLFMDRTIDLVALSDEQAEDWFFGLQDLIPCNSSFKTKSMYRWHRLRLKVRHYAREQGITIQQYCHNLMRDAWGDRWRRERQSQSQRGVAMDGSGSDAPVNGRSPRTVRNGTSALARSSDVETDSDSDSDVEEGKRDSQPETAE